MHNIWLIAKREYTERIKTKGFLIATILIPLLMGGAVFGVTALASRRQNDVAYRGDCLRSRSRRLDLKAEL